MQAVPLVASSWFAVYGPNGIPNETSTRISSAIKQVVKSGQFRKRAEERGAKAVCLGGTELAKLATSERGMWGRTIKVSGIKAD